MMVFMKNDVQERASYECLKQITTSKSMGQDICQEKPGQCSGQKPSNTNYGDGQTIARIQDPPDHESYGKAVDDKRDDDG